MLPDNFNLEQNGALQIMVPSPKSTWTTLPSFGGQEIFVGNVVEACRRSRSMKQDGESYPVVFCDDDNLIQGGDIDEVIARAAKANVK